MHYDVFNGDADGIIALLQCRWNEPKESVLVTGVKRDIKLLVRVPDEASSVTVLDISMEKNREALERLLEQNVSVFYCDHHRSGVVPAHPHLDAVINLEPDTCTSLLINELLQGKYVHWAIAAAFGDNLHTSAYELAEKEGLSQAQTNFLCELGTLINYNGYGACTEDLHIAPANLYQTLLSYPDPFALQQDLDSPYYVLKAGYEADWQQVASLPPLYETPVCRVFSLPDALWARRISGVFGNELANQCPDKAHGVVTMNPSGQDYTVSARAPKSNMVGADEICSQFPTGGGRKAAAGINALPLSELDTFVKALNNFYS